MSRHNDTLLQDDGIPSMENAVVAIFHTEWNHEVVDELLEGCRRTLAKYKVAKVVTVKVPGAVELPFACRRYYESAAGSVTSPDALVMLGCVIRGGTPHFDYVCQAVTEGATRLNLTLPVPVIFGVLTVDTLQQATDRTGGTHGHKGEEAAVTALKMIALNRQLS